MKDKIKGIILQAVTKACKEGDLVHTDLPDIVVEVPKIESHGDFSTNISMIMASAQKLPPGKIAEVIIKHIENSEEILAGIEIAGPGFINFFIHQSAWYPILRTIHEEDNQYGASQIGNGKKIQVEFVSANPTGPLHIGHGRCAAVGDSLANILSFCGYDVEREYYINDSGRQIHTLGKSVYLRYKALFDPDTQFPEDGYQGDYILDYALKIKNEDDRKHLDQPEADAIAYCAGYAATHILSGIKQDLESFGIVFDNWFSEQHLYDSSKVDTMIDTFQNQELIYEKDGALWFKTSAFGDEKDRVVVRTNGLTTYFASDIAYHQDKFERGFDRLINVLGADHHGYVPRIRATLTASGHDKNQFGVILVQLVNLLRGGEPVAMSTRAGEFVSLRNVIDEVGADAARFIFLTRHYESTLDFDLDVAKKKTNDNPVFYVQYVHARIASILRKGRERGVHDISWNSKAITLLKEPEEIQLIKIMGQYPEVIEGSAEFLEPHRITFYLMDLASAFHAYYNKHRVLTDEDNLTQGRLCLVLAVQKVIRNGLTLLGVTAPDKM